MARKKAKTKPAIETRGRPTLYTPELGEAICFALAEGGTLKQICAAEGMPARGTVHRWLVSQDETLKAFQDAHRVARAAGAFIHADEILEISDDGSLDMKTVVGQDGAVSGLIVALLTGGHVLLEGVPGVAKTLLVRSLSAALDLTTTRVQFTPDLMPADILGSEVLEEDATGKRAFRFAPGPVFGNMVLADEINRAPPKTQAALLQAMQERTVTVAGRTYDLPRPFFVLATQNPVEQEGTYPLPEAQLDRFMFELNIGYPTREEERLILDLMARTNGQQCYQTICYRCFLG